MVLHVPVTLHYGVETGGLLWLVGCQPRAKFSGSPCLRDNMGGSEWDTQICLLASELHVGIDVHAHACAHRHTSFTAMLYMLHLSHM